jgi:hypothetical protein
MSRRIAHYLRQITLGAALGCACLSVSAETEKEQTIRSLPYGVSLYHFFQDKYFSSITDLLIAEKQNTLEAQGADPELLLGSLYLAYGLHHDAGDIFDRVIEEGTTVSTRDRAWFSLARLQYKRGFIEQSALALTRIEDTLPEHREAERTHLLANVYLQQGEYDKAIETLKGFSGDSNWEAYARFNLGVALVRKGRLEEGAAQLKWVGEVKPSTRELAALRDKANLALGYSMMKFSQPEDAVLAFNEVRLNGPQSNKALLGIGWAHNTLEQYEQSLVPWMELKNRSALDPAVQETLLAIPYTLEKINRPKLALVHYDKATEIYDQELKVLDQIINAIRDGELIKAIRPATLGDEAAMTLFRSELPASISAPYLKNMMASHEFQEAVKSFQDLLFLDYQLDRWQSSLPTFELMLQERRQRYMQKLPQITADEHLNKIQGLAQQREAIAVEVRRIEQANDIFALANEDELEMRGILNDIDNRLKRLAGKKDTAAQREKYAFMEGVLYWDIAKDVVPRTWTLKRELKSLDEALAEAKSQDASLKDAWSRAPMAFEGFEGRIAGQQKRIDSLRRQVNAARKEQERFIQNLALNEILGYRQRLENYQVRARFALARLYDTIAKEETP